ncbi:MAG: Fic family protein [Burkholderiales bacterium]
MNPKDFVDHASGELVKTTNGHWAFVPSPLPPRLQFDTELVRLLSQADTALAELSAWGYQLPNPHLLISPYIRREAVLSSRIEGTQTSMSEILIEEVEEVSRPGPEGDRVEVLNYVRALELGIKQLKKLPLSLRLVRNLHATLMQGARGANKTPGEFRRGQNIVGPAGTTEASAPYVPPPYPDMTKALKAWEAYLHDREELPDLIQCALMHVQFESIHPFWDGNGRIGRLLIPIFLIERQKLSQPLLYVSAYFVEHRGDYYDLLQATRTRGEWRAWLMFFLEGVKTIATDAARQSRSLIALRERYRSRLKDKPRAISLIDQLFLNPYTTATNAERTTGVSFPTALSAIQDLVKARVLQEITGRKRGRLYIAQEIYELVAPPGEKKAPLSGERHTTLRAM